MGRRRLFTAYLSGNKQATRDCIREKWVLLGICFVLILTDKMKLAL